MKEVKRSRSGGGSTAPFLATALLVAAALSCYIDQRETVTINDIRYFYIRPSSILKSISEGREDAFTPMKAEPELASRSEDHPVSWDQAEYSRIAEALHESVWGESLAAWNLNRMYFSVDCDQSDVGLQFGQFFFFRIVDSGEEETRLERSLEIDPSRNFAMVMEAEAHPNLENWETIDLARVKISARMALQIADKSGGSEKRLAVKNSCGISVDLSPNRVSYDGWLILYSPSLYIYEVDPEHGVR